MAFQLGMPYINLENIDIPDDVLADVLRDMPIFVCVGPELGEIEFEEN